MRLRPPVTYLSMVHMSQNTDVANLCKSRDLKETHNMRASSIRRPCQYSCSKNRIESFPSAVSLTFTRTTLQAIARDSPPPIEWTAMACIIGSFNAIILPGTHCSGVPRARRAVRWAASSEPQSRGAYLERSTRPKPNK